MHSLNLTGKEICSGHDSKNSRKGSVLCAPWVDTGHLNFSNALKEKAVMSWVSEEQPQTIHCGHRLIRWQQCSERREKHHGAWP